MSARHWVLTDTIGFVRAWQVLRTGRARQHTLAHQNLPRAKAIDAHVVCSILVEELDDVTVTLVINLTTLRCAIAAMCKGYTSSWVELDVIEASNHFRAARRVTLSVKPGLLQSLPAWFWTESGRNGPSAEKFSVFVWEMSLWKAFRQFCWARTIVLMDCGFTVGFSALAVSVVLSITATMFGFESSSPF